ncbi:MAG: hypothetical protein Q9M97_08040 [Candidatus Gracilibacteria bacterium]|nr:hypothetical protein [Candidatus Gracilibacteria bacterium]
MGDNKKITDIELIEKYKLGDINAFGKIYDKYFDDIYKYIFIRISNIEIVEYLVSEIFIELLSSLENIEKKGESDIGNTLFKISDSLLEQYFNNVDFSVIDNKEFNKKLKNKVEILTYTKLKNTKNKKINIAKKGFFSFEKDWMQHIGRYFQNLTLKIYHFCYFHINSTNIIIFLFKGNNIIIKFSSHKNQVKVLILVIKRILLLSE